MTLISLDGRDTPLKTIREEAITKLHMSPTTLSSALKQLEGHGLVTRIVDITTRPPRVYYKRTPQAALPKGKVDYDEWLNVRVDLYKAILILASSNALDSPKTALEDNEDVRALGAYVSTVYWLILNDFRKLVQSNQITGIDRLRRETHPKRATAPK